MVASKEIKGLSGCYVLRSKWRPKLEKLEKTTKVGHFRVNEHNYFPGHVISEIPTATPIFSTMPNSTVASSTLTDIRRQPENKMAAFKPEVHCISGLAWDNNEMSMATPTFLTMPNLDMPRSTWSYIGRHRGQKMAAIQTGSGNNRCRATLGQVVSGTSEWGMVENVGVASEVALPSFSVQKLFVLPFCIIAILRFPCRPVSSVAYLSPA